MTFYEVLREVGQRSYRHVWNPERVDGRWAANTPDEAAQMVARYEAVAMELGAGHMAGVYVCIPQHRFTTVSVDFAGHVNRFRERPFADDGGTSRD